MIRQLNSPYHTKVHKSIPSCSVDTQIPLAGKVALATVGNCGFRFIGKFRGSGHFSGNVVKILRVGKSKFKFCDGDEYKYTLS